MGFDLKINGLKKQEEVSKLSNEVDNAEFSGGNLSAMDYVVEGDFAGEDVLKKIEHYRKKPVDKVAYGYFQEKDTGLFNRINGFLIDHSSVSLKDKAYFFHMLAVMVNAGIPVVSAVKSLVRKTDNPRFVRVLNTIVYNLEAGMTLSNSMERFSDVFDDSEVGIVRSGEATGFLDKMLFRLSSELNKKYQLNSKLWGAAFYPLVVFFILIIAAIGMLIWVFPTLLDVVRQTGIPDDQLPKATRMLIGVQSLFTSYWWAILGGVVFFYGFFKMYVSTPYGRARFDFFKLRFPLVGDLLRKISVLRFVSTLGILIDSGLPVIKALKITGESLKSPLYKAKIQEVINHVKNGGGIADNLKNAEFLFPSDVVYMIGVGEKSASLGSLSEKIADQYQLEIDNSLKRLSSVFEPLMILFVGVLVAILAIAIMAPIFNLGSNANF